MVVNLIGSEDGQGVQLYYNGQHRDWARNKMPPSSGTGNGRTVVGRATTDVDGDYASLVIDELAFFNKKLSQQKIAELYESKKKTLCSHGNVKTT